MLRPTLPAICHRASSLAWYQQSPLEIHRDRLALLAELDRVRGLIGEALSIAGPGCRCATCDPLRRALADDDTPSPDHVALGIARKALEEIAALELIQIDADDDLYADPTDAAVRERARNAVRAVAVARQALTSIGQEAPGG